MLYPTEVPLSEIRRLITALRERGGADIVAKSAWLVQGYLQNVFFGDPDTPRAMMESSDNPEVQEFLSACNELGPCINDYCDTEECETGQTFSSSSGNLSSDLSPRWKNWSAQHTDVSKTDLIRKWREAATKTDFRPPVEGPYSGKIRQIVQFMLRQVENMPSNDITSTEAPPIRCRRERGSAARETGNLARLDRSSPKASCT